MPWNCPTAAPEWKRLDAEQGSGKDFVGDFLVLAVVVVVVVVVVAGAGAVDGGRVRKIGKQIGNGFD